jgi:PIN domain nuclease of toxin-antitoxin system
VTRLLLDSHIALATVHHDLARYGQAIDRLLHSPGNDKFVSAASLWEIAIKSRLGKLSLQLPLDQVSGYLRSLGIALLDIDDRHAVEGLRDIPATRDPFDRMLLAQCQVENLVLVTVDSVLSNHPLAWRAP